MLCKSCMRAHSEDKRLPSFGLPRWAEMKSGSERTASNSDYRGTRTFPNEDRSLFAAHSECAIRQLNHVVLMDRDNGTTPPASQEKMMRAIEREAELMTEIANPKRGICEMNLPDRACVPATHSRAIK